MAWAGNKYFANIGDTFQIVIDTFDADGESVIIDLADYGCDMAKHFITSIVERTTGATALIDFDLDVSTNGQTWVTKSTHTAKDTHDNVTIDGAYRYIRAICNTRGTGNVLRITVSVC